MSTGRNFKISSRVRYLKESGTGYISTSSKMIEMKRNTENEKLGIDFEVNEFNVKVALMLKKGLNGFDILLLKKKAMI